MKELSVEQKAKAYDEALKVLHKYDGANIMFSQSLKEEMFPELKESEDERIRKAMIDYFKWNPDGQLLNEFSNREVFAWLEKQGKKKSYSSETMNEKGDFDSGFTRMMEKEQKPNPVLDIEIPFGAKNSELQEASYYIPEGFHAEIEGNRIVIKRGKQKSADKVEPKFKVGDWVVNNTTLNSCHIVKVEHGQYICDDCSFPITKENEYHLWSIHNAKDGDALYTSSTASNEIFIFKNIDEKGNMECYFAYDSEDGFREGKYHFIGKPTFKTHPATKEQRDLLFQKMKENGYKWDSEHKELMKIEQNPVSITDEWIEDYWQHEKVNNPNSYDKGDEIQFDHQGFVRFCKMYCQKHTDKVKSSAQNNPWSEEDEINLGHIIRIIGRLYDKQEKNYLKESLEGKINWLKSLKDRVQPQPQQEWTEDDENRINRLIAYFEDKESFTAEDDVVYANWLKSIRPKSQWKPSENELEVLKLVAEKDGTCLMGLYEQLKKLREE